MVRISVMPVLLCGVGPTPIGAPERLYAPGLRVWGFARALRGAGCAVDLLEVQFGAAASGGGSGGKLRLLAGPIPDGSDRSRGFLATPEVLTVHRQTQKRKLRTTSWWRRRPFRRALRWSWWRASSRRSNTAR